VGRIHTHIRSNLVGYFGVFLAMTATATALPGRETVQSNDLNPNAVKSKHIRDGQVTGADVANGGLTGADISTSSLTGAAIADNSLTGAQIEESTIDPDKLSGVLLRRCSQGAVRAAVRVNGSASFSASFTATGTEHGFDCRSTSGVVARRTGVGVYEICFQTQPGLGIVHRLAIGSAVQGGAGSTGEDNFITVGQRFTSPVCSNSAGDVFEVRVLDVGPDGPAPQDDAFVLAVVA
jgi:hypothetical protein